MDQKEIEDFAVRLGGAMVGGLEDVALETYWVLNPGSHGQFPYNKLNPLLPSNDDLIVGGLAIPPWVIGALMEDDAKKRGDISGKESGEKLREFGEGNAIYSLNMVLERLMENVLSPGLLGTRTVRKMPPGPSGSADVGHKIVKL
jgi:hypothetical protein